MKRVVFASGSGEYSGVGISTAIGRVSLAVVLALGIVCPAEAWDKAAHRMIAGHVLQVLPKKLAHLLRQHEAALLWGVVEPDFTREDDHRLPLAFLRGASKPGGADGALERFAQKGEAMLQAGTKMDEVVFVLGQAGHFAMDLNVPLHTIRGDTREEHAAYEGAAFFLEWQRNAHVYPGFSSIDDTRCFAQEIARRSHQYFRRALKNPPPSSVIETTWRDAVNDTADLWQAIVHRALGPHKSFALYGIPTPTARKGAAPFCR